VPVESKNGGWSEEKKIGWGVIENNKKTNESRETSKGASAAFEKGS